ncbi:MAG: hypothetical protein DME51_09045 [Verrucomicrobia bacterium]|nr:MAG: hypothetical protein DME51_09045 [Verrucomicrobiota bacterium]
MSGSLPPGLTLSSSGVLSGTPTSSGTFTFAIQATDRNGCTGTRSYGLTVACATISLSPSTLPDGTVGRSYSKTISAGGGSSPYSFIVISGSLPPGLTLSSSGTLSGTPTSSGTSTFAIQATDRNGCTGTRSYSLLVKPH